MKRRKITEWSAEELGTMMLAFGKMCEEANQLREEYGFGGFKQIQCFPYGQLEGCIDISLYAQCSEPKINNEVVSVDCNPNTPEEAQMAFDRYLTEVKAWIAKYRTMTEAEKLAKRIETKQAELAELKKKVKELNKKK